VVRIVVILALPGFSLLGGCVRESDHRLPEQTETRIVADVVAHVGALSIGRAEVTDRMKTDQISARAALDQLIDEALLVQEAKRVGLTEDQEDERAVERLMVRAMLHDLEQENTPESIPETEVRADYAQHPDENRSYDEAQKEIRTRLSQKKRFDEVVKIVTGLEARGLVHYDERGVEQLLSMSGLPQRAK